MNVLELSLVVRTKGGQLKVDRSRLPRPQDSRDSRWLAQIDLQEVPSRCPHVVDRLVGEDGILNYDSVYI